MVLPDDRDHHPRSDPELIVQIAVRMERGPLGPLFFMLWGRGQPLLGLRPIQPRDISGQMKKRSGELNQIPAIAKRILPHSDDTIGLGAGVFFEGDTRGAHGSVIAGEIVGFEEKAHAPTGLIADCSALFRSFGARQQ